MVNISEKFPLIKKMQNKEEVFWLNPNLDNKPSDEITVNDIKDASDRLTRFAPYINAAYPETLGGIIESPLVEINKMKAFIEREAGISSEGRLLLKRDDILPISGSIKARGGIYEVLCFAEEVALKSGMLKLTDDYSILTEERFKELFHEYSLAVGSTGNLGLSIGIMSAKLGFKVTVHMSAEARQWKKDLLREKGASVVEYEGDFGMAVEAGRKLAEGDPRCHFVDDENSKTLFLGYTVAAERLARQLEQQGITVDESNPLFVYLPCGVGGGPGGVAYGIKQIFGANAHCFFAEPVEAPCMLLGVMTGMHDKICAQDIGLTGRTAADGLAVSRASSLVGRVAGNLLDGLFTVADKKMERLIIDLYNIENIFIEPSAAAGFPGYCLTRENIEAAKNATHIVWATGGGMVPAAEREKFLNAQV